MCSPGEFVPGSQDSGSDGLHSLPGRGGVDSDLCLHTGFLVAATAALVSHAHLWCPRWWSQLAPISGARLGDALNPLSSCTLKQWSLASLAGPDFFPDSLPASCGALAPFRLRSSSQPQSSPWRLTSETGASAPSPHLPWLVSRQASQAGECWSALILCAGISLLCPLHPCCCALLCGSEAYPRHTPFPPVKGFPSVWKLFLLHSSLPEVQVPSLFFCLCFFFCHTQVHVEFLGFWEVWGLLPAFSRSSVRAVSYVDVFLMYWWGRRWSPHLTPMPSWRALLLLFSIRVESLSMICHL